MIGQKSRIVNYRYINFLVIFLGCAAILAGQEDNIEKRKKEEIPPLKERIFFGGSFGLQFGTFTDIQASPVIGLWVLPRVGVATGPNFRYYKDPLDRTTIYGGRTYVQYVFLRDIASIVPLNIHLGLFLHGEYEILSLESSFFKYPPYDSERFLTKTFLAGGGINQPVGKRASVNI
ncbi:MAG: hypothetical protein HPY62_14180, partial [Bacteroidales bacterium]|nr:hypothetical protein [Bacteroidales bacterium]